MDCVRRHGCVAMSSTCRRHTRCPNLCLRLRCRRGASARTSRASDSSSPLIWLPSFPPSSLLAHWLLFWLLSLRKPRGYRVSIPKEALRYRLLQCLLSWYHLLQCLHGTVLAPSFVLSVYISPGYIPYIPSQGTHLLSVYTSPGYIPSRGMHLICLPSVHTF